MENCEVCQTRPVAEAHNPCCSSHEKTLCCQCYRWTHFVEVGACCGAWRQMQDVIR